MEDSKEEVDEGIKVINTLSELIYHPQMLQETKKPALESANSVTEAEITENLVVEDGDQGSSDNDAYIESIDDEEPELSGPIDIVTEHEEDQYNEAPEENEIPDETDDLETEFISHETEPLLQDIANQMMHYIDESATTTVTNDDIETTTIPYKQEEEAEGQSVATIDEVNEVTQTEASEVEQATEMIDMRVSETSEAEKIENLPMEEENKNQELLELTTDVSDAIDTPTEKPVEIEVATEAEVQPAVNQSVDDISSSTAASERVTEQAIDATTQAIIKLTSRTTVMEPHAEISSTIANFIHTANDEVTTVSTLSYEATTKDTRRKLAQILLLKFSLTFFNSPQQKKFIEPI